MKNAYPPFHLKSAQGPVHLGNISDPPLAPQLEVISFKDFTFGKSKSEVTPSQRRGGGQAGGGSAALNQAPPGMLLVGMKQRGRGQPRELPGEVNEALLRAMAAGPCAESVLQM